MWPTRASEMSPTRADTRASKMWPTRARDNWLLLALLPACAAANMLQGRVDGLREIAAEAREKGALNCAPQELALAEANIAFAQLELDQGDEARAKEHVILAAPNANAALKISAPGHCGAPSLNDRDRDGIPDGD